MARFKSHIFTEIRGQLGGNVFSKNKSGLVVRSRRTANSVYTQSNSIARSNFAYISSFWRSLTEPQQEQWHAASEGKGGFQLFKKRNSNRLLLGLGLLPEPVIDPDQAIFTVEVKYRVRTDNVVVFEVGYLYDIPQPEWKLYIMSTGALSAGISRVTESYYRFLVIQPDGEDQGDDIDVGPEWQALYGSPVDRIGNAAFIKVKAIHKPSGYATPYKQVRGIITLI